MIRTLLLSLVAAACLAAPARAADRPNILFAFADDWGRYASAYAKVDGRRGPNNVV